MAIIDVPVEVRFTDFDIELDAVSDEMKSVFNGRRQIAKLPYDVWGFRGDLVPVDPMEAGPIKAFLMRLAGRVNAFKLKIAGSKYPVSNYKGPNGKSDSVPAYDPNIASCFIKVKNLSPSALILRAGDYFNIGNELKVATLPRVSEADGTVYLYFMPPLRKQTLNQDVTIADPFLYLHATSDNVAKWNVKPPIRHSFKLEAEEEIE